MPGELLRLPHARDDVPHNALARNAHDIADDERQLDVHLHERLLHPLHPARLFAQQHFALAHDCADDAHVVAQSPCCT